MRDEGEWEAALLHACNAIDGTAAKRFPGVGSRRRFIDLLRSESFLLEQWGTPGVAADTVWPVVLQPGQRDERHGDTADLIYTVYRCAQGHGEEMAPGWELTDTQAGSTTISASQDRVRLPQSVVLGMALIAVIQPENSGQLASPGDHFSWHSNRFEVNGIWGDRGPIESAMRAHGTLPTVKLDFMDWYTVRKRLV